MGDKSKIRSLILTASLLGMGIGGATTTYADEFEILNAATTVTNNVYQLTANIDYQLTEEVMAAVRNGVGAMPPFGQSLKEDQVDDVARYVYEATRR